MNRVYVLGRFSNPNQPEAWELQGVFADLGDAAFSAVNYDYFVLSIIPDLPLPKETASRPIWYPKRAPMPDGFF